MPYPGNIEILGDNSDQEKTPGNLRFLEQYRTQDTVLGGQRFWENALMHNLILLVHDVERTKAMN